MFHPPPAVPASTIWIIFEYGLLNIGYRFIANGLLIMDLVKASWIGPSTASHMVQVLENIEEDIDDVAQGKQNRNAVCNNTLFQHQVH
jgi:hypothetical protein